MEQPILAQTQQDKDFDHGRMYPAEFGAPFEEARTSTGTDGSVRVFRRTQMQQARAHAFMLTHTQAQTHGATETLPLRHTNPEPWPHGQSETDTKWSHQKWRCQ